MSENKFTTKAIAVYALGVFVVVLCVGAAVLNVSYENCLKSGGTWGTISCSK